MSSGYLCKVSTFTNLSPLLDASPKGPHAFTRPHCHLGHPRAVRRSARSAGTV